MSEFSLILNIVSTVVTALFELTLDIACTTMFAVSCMGLWRWMEIAALLSINSSTASRKKWRNFCCTSLFVTLFDVLVVASLVLALFSPLRWRLIGECSYSRNKHVEYRIEVFCHCLQCLRDVVCMLVGSLCLLSFTGRQVTMYNLYDSLHRELDQTTTYSLRLDHYMHRLFSSGMSSGLDLVVLVATIPSLLFAPSTWYTVVKVVSLLNASPSMVYDPTLCRSSFYSYAKSYFKDRAAWSDAVCGCFVVQILHAWIDILTTVPCLISLLSPIRHGALIRFARRERTPVTPPLTNIVNAGFENIFAFHYDYELRMHCFTLAALAISDVLLLPMLSLLWITQYRYHAIKSKLWPPDNVDSAIASSTVLSYESIVQGNTTTTTTTSNSEDGADSAAIAGADIASPVQQGSMQLPILESSPVLSSAHHDLPPSPSATLDTATASKSSKLWGMQELSLISGQVGWLLIDVFALLIPVPLVLVTRVRWRPVRDALFGWTDVFVDRNCELYSTVWSNFLLVLHDVFLLLPSVVILPCFLFVYRMPIVWDLIKQHSLILTTRQSIDDTTPPQPSSSSSSTESAAYNNNNNNNNNTISSATLAHSETIFQWEQSLKVRWLLWGQCVESLFDLLFMAMGAVVIASMWRSLELFAGFKYQQKLHIKSTSPTQATTTVSTTTSAAPPAAAAATTRTLSSSLHYKRFLEGMRGTIFMEFLCTLRDLLCVLPMAIVIASLYRLPQLLVELYGLVVNSKSALHTEPLFEVDSCHVEFPEKGGPHINFYCRRKSSSTGGTATSTTDDAHHSNINPLTGDARDHTTTATTATTTTTTTTTTVNTSEAVVVDGCTFQLDTSSSSVEMHVSGDDLWKHAAGTFGQVVVSAVRNYLPLKLVDQVSVGWSDFVHNEFMHYSSMDNHSSTSRPIHPSPPIPPPPSAAASVAAADDDDVVRNLHASIDRGAVSILADNHQTDANTSLWMRLDFGTTKRSTILKKLRLLPAATTIEVQLETMVTVLDPMASHVTHRKQYHHHHQKKKKVVLLRVAPTIRNIIDVLETSTTTGTPSVAAGVLPIDALNKPPVYRRDQTAAAAAVVADDDDDADKYDPKNRVSNLVNSYHMTVCLICIEVLIDLAMLVLLCLTMISPVRFARLLYTLLEPENKLPLRIMQHTMSGIKYLDGHLLSYRREVAVPCNVMAKSIKCKLLKPSRYDVDHSFNSWYYNEADNARYQLELSDFHCSPDNEYFRQVVGSIDKRHYRPYVRLAKSSKKTLSLFPGCESMEALLDERLRLYHLVIKLRYMRITADLSYMTAAANTFPRNVNTVPVVTSERLQHRGVIGKDRLAAIELVLIEEHDRIARKLLHNELSMKTLIDSTIKDIATANHKPICATHQSCLKSLKNLLKRCGLLSRPIKDTRLMVTLSCIQALQDIGFLLLTLFILFTLVRTVPLIRDLWSVGSCNPMKYRTKLILIKHAMALANDLKSIFGFLCCTIIIVAFVGGIPSFLRDLPSHIDTYDRAFRIAAKHANKSIIKFCEVLVLITAFRTYRIVFRSAMYCLIIPGACLAEACPLICLSAIQRFILGLLTWFGLLVGAIVVAIRTDSDQSSASHFRISLLAIGGAMFGVLLLSAVTVSTRRIYTQPDSRAVSSLKFTWNHILALITGPLESIQLSAVIMYFFWNYSRNRSSDALGTDSLSAVLMVWGYQGDINAQQTHSLYYYDAGDRDALDISILVASIAVFVWAIVISIPLVWSSGAEREQQWNAGNNDRNRDKVIKFKDSALVEFFSVLLSRILCVWIMATLMRTTSCVDKEEMIPFDYGGGVTTVEVVAAVVVSTSQRVSCSNNHWWAAHSSLALLLFYMITSSILNADEADLLRENYRGGGGGGVKSKEASVVKFAPLYALCVRAAQFFVCIACFGGFEAQSVYIPLIPVLLISLLITIIPQAVMVTCSVVAVGSLRSAGFACVCWTTVVCIIRGAGETSSIWSTESCIYVGWGVIYVIAIIIAVYEEFEVTRRWRELLEQSGLLASIEALVGFLSDRSTLEVLSEQSLHYTFTNNTHGLQKYVTVVSGSSGGGDGMKNKHFVNYYMKRVQQSTRSVKDIATFLILLEESILADRLTDDFLKHREQWVANLKTVCNNYYSDDKLLLISDGASPSAINLSDLHTHTLQETRDVETAVVGRVVRGQSDVGSDPFRTIIASIEQLRAGINTQVVTVRFTRKIFTILLSHRVPMELCWVIFEYLVYSEGLRQVLLRDLVDNKEKLLVVHDRTIEAFMRDCDNYLSYRRKELSEVTLTKSSFLL